MWSILDKLFLGTRHDAEQREELKRNGITHIVNCTREVPCFFEDEFRYLHLRLSDPDEGLAAQLKAVEEFIDRGRVHGAVLVHCTGGVSRSAAVVLAYLGHLGYDLQVAAEFMGSIVRTRPNGVFIRQVYRHLGVDPKDEQLKSVNERLGASM